MNVEITIKKYEQDDKGNTPSDKTPTERVITIPYDQILWDQTNGLPSGADPDESSILDGRIVFRYKENTNGLLYGNDHNTASASNAELSSQDPNHSLDQPGDPLNDELLKLESTTQNIIDLEKNEYPSATFRVTAI